MNKIILGSSGASGAHLVFKIAKLLPSDYEPHIILTKASEIVLQREHGIYDINDIAAKIASGSFQANMMMIAPCSMNTLAKIACGISDNLLTRAASVMIKEQKKLLLAPRELPFDAIMLENMLKLARLHVIIAPPVIGYYAKSANLDELENFFIGKWFDLLGIPNSLYKRWQAEEEE